MSGTGVGLVNDEGEITVTKSALSSIDWLRTEQWEFVENNLMESHVILGHTRAPTFANTVHAKNAQPYWYNNTDNSRSVVLTHNGHIEQHHKLTDGLKGFTHPVDSAHVARAMAEAADPKDLLPGMRGNYSLVWYDEQRRLIMAANNGGRELWIAGAKNKKEVYYASERTMLKFCLDRSGVDYTEIAQVPEFRVMYWELDAKELIPCKFFKYKEKPLYVAPVQQPYVCQGGASPTASKKGATVWASMREGTSLILYPDHHNGVKSEYGKVICTVPASNGSICELHGVKKETWNTLLSVHFKNGNTFPVKVDTFEMEDGPDGKKYPLYNAQLDMEELNREVSRVIAISNVGSKAVVVAVPGAISPTFVPGPGKSVKITQEAWDKVAAEGCFYCEASIVRGDVGRIGWQLVNTSLAGEDQYSPICPPCICQIERGELSPVVDRAI